MVRGIGEGEQSNEAGFGDRGSWRTGAELESLHASRKTPIINHKDSKYNDGCI